MNIYRHFDFTQIFLKNSSKLLILVLTYTLAGSACKKKTSTEPQTDPCIRTLPSASGAAGGSARTFIVDPMVSANSSAVSPLDGNLDAYATSTPISDLTGQGVLNGKYVYVGAGSCDGDFLAQSASNQFEFHHGDSRFSEAMTYHYGSSYRSFLNSVGYLEPVESIWMVTDCTDDNAFFYRNPFTGLQLVCLGVSTKIKNASFTDDASVSVHELQHATTVHTYSSQYDLNQFHYDEAGGLNEALSDFMSLTFLAPQTTSFFDPRTFSRWALGTFYGSHSGERGAHRCPTYDPAFPNCSTFGQFSSATNTVSYIYPDGLGWPYANNFSGADKLKTIFDESRVQEEIHNIAVLMTGALWDVYEGIKANHGGNPLTAQQMTSQLILEGLRQAPKPSSTRLSPVTFRSYATSLQESAALLGWNLQDVTTLNQKLQERGLINGVLLDATWAGKITTDGEPGMVKVIDNPSKVRAWVEALGGDRSLIPQNAATGLNDRLDPGEVALLWFNIQNNSSASAGGIEINVELLDPEISLFTDPNGLNFNIGALNSKNVQIQYGKIYGSDMVAALSQSGHITGAKNTYFLTNPYFAQTFRTGIWVKVSKTAAHGKVVTFRVTATPSNGAASTVDFPVTIQ